MTAFQDALALMIRLPEKYREGDEAAQWLQGFDLTEREYGQLVALAKDRNVRKYGRSMRGVRFDNLQRNLKILPHFIPGNLLEEICQRGYDPTAASYRSYLYPIRFMEFLMTNDRAAATLRKNTAPFVQDIIKYEHAQLQFRKQVLDRTNPLPGDTPLLHRCFLVVDFDYDVLGILQARAQLDPRSDDAKRANLAPKAKKATLLMLGDLKVPNFRTFEIDQDTASFLRSAQERYEEWLHANSGDDLAQSDSANGQSDSVSSEGWGQLPNGYADLVEVGLCRPIPDNQKH